MAQHRAAFGFAINREDGGLFAVAGLQSGTVAQQAGLQDGDILVALDGEKVPRSPERWLRDHQPNERVTVTVRRGGEEREFSFALGRQSVAVYQVGEAPEPTEKQRRIRDGILRGKVDPPR